MKTIEEFIKEIENSEALQNELKAVKDKVGLAELLKKYGVNATAEEYEDAVKSIVQGEISDDEAEAAAGGFDPAYLVPYIDFTPLAEAAKRKVAEAIKSQKEQTEGKSNFI